MLVFSGRQNILVNLLKRRSELVDIAAMADLGMESV